MLWTTIPLAWVAVFSANFILSFVVIKIRDTWDSLSLKNSSEKSLVLSFANSVSGSHCSGGHSRPEPFKSVFEADSSPQAPVSVRTHPVCPCSVLSDRSCLRVTAGPASLDLDVSVQRTLDNTLATEAYERRIKRLEQEKLELGRKLQGKYVSEMPSSVF